MHNVPVAKDRKQKARLVAGEGVHAGPRLRDQPTTLTASRHSCPLPVVSKAGSLFLGIFE